MLQVPHPPAEARLNARSTFPPARLLSGALLAVVMSVALFTIACGGGNHEYVIVGTDRAAGVDGLVEVETIEGGNRLVTLTIDHMPPPARFNNATTYVVWFTPPGRQPVKAGQLQYDESSRQGRMMATTPLRRFHVRVSAEQNADIDAPSDVVVCQRRVEN